MKKHLHPIATLLCAVLVPAITAAVQDVARSARVDASHLVVPQLASWSLDPGREDVSLDAMRASVDIVGASARTTLDLTLANPGGRNAEATLLLPVPSGAAVVGFDLEGTAAASSARLLPADEARTTYEGIVAKLKDPALLEFAGEPLVRTSVFPVPAGGSQRVRLVYEQVLVPDGGRFDYVLPRSESLARAVPWELSVSIDSNAKIAALYSPSHALVERERTGHSVKLDLAGEAASQPGSFKLSWVTADAGLGASVFAFPDLQEGGGWFLLMAGLPSDPLNGDRPSVLREVTLVLDRSGSMNGEKFEQARSAALQVLAGLDDGESFQIVDYASEVADFAPTPVVLDAIARERVRAYLAGLRPVGGTNLHGALQRALATPAPPGRLPLVLFLTDGLPTEGNTSEVAIRSLVEEANPGGRRVFSFGVGNDVNAPLLDRLADASGGRSTYVLPGMDVEVAVGRVFDSLHGPALMGLEIAALNAEGKADATALRALQPELLSDLYPGEPLVVLGRYREDFAGRFRISADAVDGRRAFELPFAAAHASRRFDFVPRLWASRRINQLTESVRQAGAEGEVAEAVLTELSDEIVRLSTRFGILTEYTSYLATEGTSFEDWGELVLACNTNLVDRAVAVRSGAAGVNQSLNNDVRRNQQQVDYSNRVWTEGLEFQSLGGVQQVGSNALFRRGRRWIDGRLVADELPEPDEVVLLGTARHGELVAELTAEGEQGLVAFDGEVLLRRGSRVVLVQNDAPTATSSGEMNPLGTPVPGSATPVLSAELLSQYTSSAPPSIAPMLLETGGNVTPETLRTLEPAAFLEGLQHVSGWLTVWGELDGWVGRDDVEALLPLLRDDTPCAAVVASKSSVLPLGVVSTVGREAAFLIEGHRSGVFPPRLSSVSSFDPDPAEIEVWWAANEAADPVAQHLREQEDS